MIVPISFLPLSLFNFTCHDKFNLDYSKLSTVMSNNLKLGKEGCNVPQQQY